MQRRQEGHTAHKALLAALLHCKVLPTHRSRSHLPTRGPVVSPHRGTALPALPGPLCRAAQHSPAGHSRAQPVLQAPGAGLPSKQHLSECL